MNFLLLVFLLTMSSAFAGDPQFDPSTLMKFVLVPADATVGSVIYRLRATDVDFDYPLQFELLDEGVRTTFKIDNLPCSRFNSLCQANVVLLRRLDPGRYHDFRVRVRDTKGGSSTISCTITATNSTTPRDIIFPHIPELIMVPEDAKRGTELGYVIVRKKPTFPKPSYLELWGSPLFGIRQRAVTDENTEGTIYLLGPLDFEKQAMYHLTILANDPYIIPKYDTRNIAGVQIVIVVQDVQDQPPIFTEAPPVTQLNNSLVPGDIIARVHAEDGDKGSPRPIQYGLVSEGNPFTPFFNISEKGEIMLVRPLDEIVAISHPGVPILLTVVAEEVKTGRDEPPAMSSTVQLALLLGERGNQPPYFESDNYVSRIEENALQGTALVFSDPYVPQVSDDDLGKNGVFALTLENNNGTFEILPNVAERRTDFLIKVRDNTLLDYETRHSVNFRIVAQELGPATNLSTSVDVTVFITDMNDNAPVFLQESYFAELPENMTAVTRVVQVQAEDVDTNLFGKVRYTQILGHLNTSLHLDPKTGVITVTTDNHGFDREMQEEYHFYVEARDEDGEGNRATVPLTVKLMDVNDNPPVFEKSLYEFILSPDLRNFTSPAIIRAIDIDADYPNNEVRYEIIQGNYEDHFFIVPETGELLLKRPLPKHRRNQRYATKTAATNRTKRETNTNADIYVLVARAYDLGVPHLATTCEIRIYPPESRARTMVFIVPGRNPDWKTTEETLSTITGGRVTIQSIRPYSGTEIGATDVTSGGANSDKSVVVANVLYNSNSVVDVSHIQSTINNHTSASSIAKNDGTVTSTVREYRSESSNLLFWLLLLLAFLILALIILLLCCLCQGCPLYTPLKRVFHSQSVAENVHLVHNEKEPGQENKSIQAVEWNGRSTRKEAWSADIADSRTKPTQWQFNRRNQKHKDTLSLKGYDNGSLKDMRADDEKSTLKIRDGPNIIYSRDWQTKNLRNKEQMYIEDVEGDYTNITRFDHHANLKHPNHIDDEYDGESLRRHEIDRGSDDVKHRGDVRRSLQRQEATSDVINETERAINNARDQLFIRDGNTEILRLITRGRPDEIAMQQSTQQAGQQRPITIVQQPPQYIMVDNGKDILMQRYIEQQSILNPTNQMGNYQQKSNAPSVITQNELNQPLNVPEPSSESIPVAANTPQPSQTRKSTPNVLLHQELLETSLRQQNELLRQILLEKERLQQRQDELLRSEELKLETQSLPGHSVMATQTDCNTSTQTDLQFLRPDRRKTRSDNDSYSDEDDEDEYQVYIIGGEDVNNSIRLLKRRKYFRRRRSRVKDDRRILRVVEEIKRKIKTPILEESESPTNGHDNRRQIQSGKQRIVEDRQSTVKSAHKETSRPVKSGGIQKEVLLEISDTLDDQIVPTIRDKRRKLRKMADYYLESDQENDKKKKKYIEVFSDDSLDQDQSIDSTIELKNKANLMISKRDSSTELRENLTSSSTTTQSEKKLNTATETDEQHSQDKSKEKISKNIQKIPAKPTRNSKSNTKDTIITHLVDKDNRTKPTTTPVDDKKVDVTKSVPRYMQWYKNKKERDRLARDDKDSTSSTKSKSDVITKTKPKRVTVKKATGTESDKSTTQKSTSEKESKDKSKPVQLNNTAPIVQPAPPPPVTLKNPIQSNGGPIDASIPVRPLLQHSEHRYEHMYPYPPTMYAQTAQIPQHLYTQSPTYANQTSLNAPPPVIIQPSLIHHSLPPPPPSDQQEKQSNEEKTADNQQQSHKIEDDYDSGIAMTSLQQVPGALKKPAITEKKSVFTIAYDDMHTKQLTADSDTPPY